MHRANAVLTTHKTYYIGQLLPMHIFSTTKYCMVQFVHILLLVTVIYLTLILCIKTMFGDYTRLFAIMVAMFVTCMVILITTVS